MNTEQALFCEGDKDGVGRLRERRWLTRRRRESRWLTEGASVAGEERTKGFEEDRGRRIAKFGSFLTQIFNPSSPILFKPLSNPLLSSLVASSPSVLWPPALPQSAEDYGLVRSDFDNPDHFRQYIRYCQRLDACGPFDIDFLPDLSVGLFGLIEPCGYEYGDYKEEVDKCVRHAIAYAKKEKKMELEDPKVIKANLHCHSGTMFYITFDAEDKRSGERQLYDAKVMFGLNAYRGKHGVDEIRSELEQSIGKGNGSVSTSDDSLLSRRSDVLQAVSTIKRNYATKLEELVPGGSPDPE